MNVHAAALADAHLPDEQTSAFAREALQDLSQQPKRLSPKFFYDAAGSELFEAITRLPEYYPTRTELSILKDRAGEIGSFVPEGAALVEFGAGSTTKVRLLLDRCAVAAYVPVDISGEFVKGQADVLRRDFPALAVHPVAADFTTAFKLPDAIAGLPKVGFFPGSTIGNFEPHEAGAFLRHAGRMLGHRATLIIGVDLVKEVSILHAAYNDAAGLTAKFNLNLLARINRELDGDFDLKAFDHRALYNSERHRIEMHLVSKTRQQVRAAGRAFDFAAGETIHTENSYKYTLDHFTTLARGAGWTPVAVWTDSGKNFSVHALAFQDR